jgi:hypothetical protein
MRNSGKAFSDIGWKVKPEFVEEKNKRFRLVKKVLKLFFSLSLTKRSNKLGCFTLATLYSIQGRPR